MRRTRAALAAVTLTAGALFAAGASASETAAAAAAAVAAGVFTVVDLGTLEPGGTAGPLAINTSGAVAGTASLDLHSRAFLHDGSGMRDLGVLAGMTDSGASDLNAGGAVVGWSTSSTAVDSRAVRFERSGPRDLGDLGGGWAVAIGVSDSGVVVGSSATAAGERHGFRWDGGAMVDLNDVLPLDGGAWVEDGTRVDDRGRIIGRLHLADGEIIGYWFDGTSVHEVRLGPGDFTNVAAFSDAGVVGTSSSGPSGPRAFLWRDGTAVELPPVAGDACTDARDIDSAGRAVGTSSGCGRGTTRAVLWQDGRAVDLQSLLAPDGAWRLRNATAINDAGEIAAVALDPSGGTHAVVLEPRHDATLLAGADRTATAILAGAIVPRAESSTAVLASARAPADAAVAAVLAARRQAPLLLTEPAGLEARVTESIAAHVWPGGTVEIVGGPGAISPSIEAGIAALGFTVVRHAGADRYETAVRVAEATGSPGPAVLVAGDAIDAAAAIPLAVHRRAALLYTAGTALPSATKAYLDAHPGWPRTGIGRAASADPTATALAGVDRVATAALVATAAFPDPGAVVVAPAWSPIDAVVAGRVAASAGAPVLLTGPALAPAVSTYLSGRQRLAGVWTVGGLGSTGVTDAITAALYAR